MMNVNSEKCIGCGLCVKDCFPKDIEIVDGKAKLIMLNVLNVDIVLLFVLKVQYLQMSIIWMK